jgi:hypothetical protein
MSLHGLCLHNWNGLDLMFARWIRCCGIWSNVPWRCEDSGKYMYFVRFCGSITRLDIADQMPGGPDRRLIFLNPTGPYRHLGLARKSLVQTGRDFEAPFKTVRSRASSKPDWPDYWEPWMFSQGSPWRTWQID